MKKNYLLPKILLLFVLFLTFPSTSLAATLYSNDFTLNYSGFSETFGTCSPSASGLTCTGTDAFYTTTLPTMKCISANIDIHNIRDGIFFADGNYTSWVGFAASGTLGVSDGHLHAYASNSTDIDLGVNTPGMGSFHNYKICKNTDTYSFYLDSSLIGTKVYSGHTGGYFGFEAKSGTIITNMLVIDTLPISDIHLSVPSLKQTSNPWQSQLYDSANKWSPGNSSINIWGCAVTSAAMVLQYNGITKMPDNSPLNPGTLNTWLKSQKDGYVGNGLVNWLALQRFTQLVKLAFNNPGFTADALEYKRVKNADKVTLLSDLQNNHPDILEQPGHFVVATGTSGTTFTINDPYFSRNTLNDGYNNTFLTLGRFIPSHTDLSYILLVGPLGLDFSMKNSSGSAVGEEFVQQPLSNPTNPSLLSGLPIKLFYLTQPGNDIYNLTITNASNTPYDAQAYVYDTSGNVQVFDLAGSGNQNNPDNFTINYTKTNDKQDSIKKQSVFDNMYTDINTFCQQNQIKKNTCHELLDQINDAKNQYDKHHIVQEKIELAELLIKLIIWNGNHTISDTVYQTLVSDITYLLTH
ncbi:MAG TPA: C39 family peptidase [Candidatus Saccharimonadales bacterium]|nr:C39 family peptidase [Candidatus Saccharimonadales bacterium]